MDDEVDKTLDGEEEPKPQYVDEVRALLLQLFRSRRREVFYDRQLAILLERRGELDITPRDKDGRPESTKQVLPVLRNYYHWVTSRALRQLVESGQVASEVRNLGVVEEDTDRPLHIRFFRYPSHRFWKRQADEITGLVRQFCRPEFTHALGSQGEVMFDSALGHARFVQVARHVNEYEGRRWTASGHNLDRIYVRDGVAWGAEIKNTLKYIERAEFDIKRAMCEALGIRFLVIARALPSHYIWTLFKAGGFGLVFGKQLYPFGQEAFADRVRQTLELPVHSPKAVPEGEIQRFLSYHAKLLAIRNGPR